MLKMVVSAFFATIGFAVMFNIRGKKLFYSALGGSVAAFVYYLCLYVCNFENFMSLFWASVALAIYSEIMARKLKAPVTVFAICALICFVPGGGMYYTMLAIVNKQNMEAITLLIDTLASAGALALGIVLVSTLTGAYYRVIKKNQGEQIIMIKVERISVMNFENAIRGARNPLNSWAKGDSYTADDGSFVMGPNDLSLAQRLCAAGSDHRKFIRQIFISMDITAPLYWWKEFDTYKVGTVANSTSTMHKIHSKEFGLEDFSVDHMNEEGMKAFEAYMNAIEAQRKLFVETKDKSYWYTMIQMLPTNYNQMRTVTMNYENVRGMFASRKNHKLDEWHTFCDYIRELPYAKELLGIEEE